MVLKKKLKMSRLSKQNEFLQPLRLTSGQALRTRPGQILPCGSMKGSWRYSRCGGFTLIELMVVMVIMLIIAAVVIPSVSNTTSLKATSAARILAADIEYAQNVSITYQESVTITFDTSAESYSLSNASGPLIHPITKATYTVEFGSQTGLEEVNIVSTDFPGGTITFNSLGVPDNSGTAKIQAGSKAYLISVAPATGKVTVQQDGS